MRPSEKGERMTLTRENAMFGHVSEDTAYVVDDYPYGFRLRTKIRYWIETTKHGDRLCSQTLNPKTGAWNKPKRSTYSHVGVMMLDEQEHVTWAGVGPYTDEDALTAFLDVVRDQLSPTQLDKAAELVAARRVMRHVTVSIHEGAYTEDEAREQDRAKATIARAWHAETGKVRGEMEGEAQ